MFINTCGYVLLYWNLKKVYKHSMFSKIEKGEIKAELKELIIPNNLMGSSRFVRIESREIKYDGKMYDIIKEYSRNDSIHFFCINDENEDFLDRFFLETVESNTNKKSDHSPLHNILKLALSSAVINDDETYIFVSSDKYYPAMYLFPDDHPQEIQTPPPQFLM